MTPEQLALNERRLLVAARVRAMPFKPKMICVWNYQDAPKEFKALSEHGGDEDWVIFVPPDVEEPNWLYSAPFYHDPQKTELGSEYGTIYISAHA